MLHPDIIIGYTEELGQTLVARRAIPLGTIIYVPDPLTVVVPPDSPWQNHPVYGERLRSHGILLDDGCRLLAADGSQDTNHCCRGASVNGPLGVSILGRAVFAGEVICEDYRHYVRPPQVVPAAYACCAECPLWVGLDWDRAEWETEIRAALAQIDRVPQPLTEAVLDAGLAQALREGQAGDYLTDLIPVYPTGKELAYGAVGGP